MTKFIKTSFLLLFVSLSVASFGQKMLNKGMIKMELTKVESDDPQMAMQLEMMKGSLTEVHFNENQYFTNMSMMGGMVEIKNHVNEKENKMNMLFDMMGQKMWIESNLEEAQSKEQKDIAALSEIKYDKSETKDILGYKCYKMTITNPEMDGMAVSGFVTQDIKTKANLVQGFQSLKFEGYPMEFTIGNPQFSMTMTAVEIKDTVDDKIFKLNTTGYTKMSMEEFQKNMGGFGF